MLIALSGWTIFSRITTRAACTGCGGCNEMFDPSASSPLWSFCLSLAACDWYDASSHPYVMHRELCRLRILMLRENSFWSGKISLRCGVGVAVNQNVQFFWHLKYGRQIFVSLPLNPKSSTFFSSVPGERISSLEATKVGFCTYKNELFFFGTIFSRKSRNFNVLCW